MKIFVLFLLTLCVAHAEITRHRLRSSRNEGRSLSKPARSLRQILRRHRGISESLASRRVARSIFLKDFSSGHGEYAMANAFKLDVDWGSGIASGFDYDSSFWVNEEIDLEESQTETADSRKIILSKTDSQRSNHTDGTNPDKTQPNQSPSSRNSGILNVLKLPKRIEKRSVFRFIMGSGDAGSGSSSEGGNDIIEVSESSGSKVLDKVILSTNVIQRQYSQAGVPESVATSLGSGGGDSIASNSVMCVGDIGCDHGSGIIHVNPAEAPIMRKPTHSSIGRETDSRREFLGSGTHAIEYQQQP